MPAGIRNAAARINAFTAAIVVSIFFTVELRLMKQPINTSDPEFRARAEKRRATWTIDRYRDLDAIKAAEYAFWASQPTHAVMAAVSEITAAAYAMKGIHVSRLHRPHRAP
jgi:hypothetical protein